MIDTAWLKIVRSGVGLSRHRSSSGACWSRKRFCARVVAGSEDPEISSVTSDSAWLDGYHRHLVMGAQGSRFKVSVCLCACVCMCACHGIAIRFHPPTAADPNVLRKFRGNTWPPVISRYMSTACSVINATERRRAVCCMTPSAWQATVEILLWRLVVRRKKKSKQMSEDASIVSRFKRRRERNALYEQEIHTVRQIDHE